MVDLDARPAPTPFAERVGLLAVRSMEALHLSIFRLSKGRAGGTIFGAPVILLTTAGRRTGDQHTKPLLALDDEGSWIVVGSRGGTSEHPDWFRNLLAYHRPEAERHGAQLTAPEVEHAHGTTTVDFEVLEGDERATWWARLTEVYPKFDAYQHRATERTIPVIRLTPTSH
jgi:deazaflavin-dependent oxidoreductase (nitroreductase family)